MSNQLNNRKTMWKMFDDDLYHIKQWLELVSYLGDFKVRALDEADKIKIEEVIQLVLLKIEKTSQRIREIRTKLNERNDTANN